MNKLWKKNKTKQNKTEQKQNTKTNQKQTNKKHLEDSFYQTWKLWLRFPAHDESLVTMKFYNW